METLEQAITHNLIEYGEKERKRESDIYIFQPMM